MAPSPQRVTAETVAAAGQRSTPISTPADQHGGPRRSATSRACCWRAL
jgi:hypothetical protein